MDTEKISKTELGWLAGIIDGEGCIYARINKHNKSIRKLRTNGVYVIRMGVSITNTDVFLIREVSRICEQMKVGFAYSTKPPRAPRKGVISIIIEGKGRCKKLLSSILPYLINKKSQAEVLLELIKYRESLGYKTTKGWKVERTGKQGPITAVSPPDDWKPLCENPKILGYIKELKTLKEQTVLPSETKRVANRKLGLPIR